MATASEHIDQHETQPAALDERWTLIRYPLVNRTQLFELQDAPEETTNLRDKSERAATMKELTALLEKERAHFPDPGAKQADAGKSEEQ